MGGAILRYAMLPDAMLTPLPCVRLIRSFLPLLNTKSALSGACSSSFFGFFNPLLLVFFALLCSVCSALFCSAFVCVCGLILDSGRITNENCQKQKKDAGDACGAKRGYRTGALGRQRRALHQENRGRRGFRGGGGCRGINIKSASDLDVVVVFRFRDYVQVGGTVLDLEFGMVLNVKTAIHCCFFTYFVGRWCCTYKKIGFEPFSSRRVAYVILRSTLV